MIIFIFMDAEERGAANKKRFFCHFQLWLLSLGVEAQVSMLFFMGKEDHNYLTGHRRRVNVELSKMMN